jgi:hypothetical protein
MKQIQDLKLEVFVPSAIFTRLAPSYLHLFWPVKDALGGCHFRSDEEVREAVHYWLVLQPKDFFSRGIYALVEWRRCVERGGDYIED